MYRQQSFLQIVRHLSVTQMVFLAVAGSTAITCSFFAGRTAGKTELHAESRELIAGFERKVADLQHSLDSERERVGRFSDANRRLSGDADALREKLGSVVQKLQNKDWGLQ